ncbi:MAG: NADH-quinone oxidoreductase subunit L, partial [Acidimicrobiia bacterium]
PQEGGQVMTELLWLLIALPLAGSVFLHFFGRRIGAPRAGYIATLATAGSFAVALGAALPFFRGDSHGAQVTMWEWMPSVGASFEINWDPLAALMTLVVTGVGSLIHIYAVGYMHGDPRFSRFFTYLNLFAASMLTLVLAGNFAMLFVGWELVGLCSYLLISFWFTKPVAAAAGKKAFIVNRIGDLGFLIGLMVIFASFHTLAFTGILERAEEVLSPGMATAIGLLILIGAAGKSAQIPLYVWLPDAMEGPTPVSALIHAATMVTAGVYVIARSAAIFQLSPIAGPVVATIGAATALWAATIAIAQTDIKRVLAYSTISQLGYMFLAVGAAGYVAGVFHLMTHAFFKALLFLGAGSVIHGLGGEQDMQKMGGLRKVMPVTAATMAIATVAIAGIPPLAGFWSKDEVLGVAFGRGGWFGVLWLVGLVTALITAFYMTRQFVMVFLGQPRWDDAVHPHESPRVMTLPLIVLAGLSIVGGLVNTPLRLGLEHFLEPSFEGIEMSHPPEGWGMFALLAVLSVGAGLAGAVAAFLAYKRPAALWRRFEASFGRIWEMWADGYRIDDLYGLTVVGPARKLAEAAAFRFDLPVIDGLVNGAGRIVREAATWGRGLQTGLVRSYGLAFGFGVVLVVAWLLARGGL